MGHASQIALGIALQKPERRVVVFDGDGAAIMHLGNMAITASQAPRNYIHIVYNNGAHDSVGGQPTVGLEINLPEIGAAMGYKTVLNVTNAEELQAALGQLDDSAKPALLQICVRKGNRKDLGRPTTTPQENKNALMEELCK
jgi:phosphonopyruvate decarboxylase